MIKVKASGIKSGWRSVFMVLTTAAADSHEPIADLAFEIQEQSTCHLLIDGERGHQDEHLQGHSK